MNEAARRIVSVLARLHSDERGVGALLLGLTAVAIIGFAALAVDLGWMQFTRSRLQTSADVGALAGAGSLLSKGDDLAAVRSVAQSYARRNLIAEDKPAAAVGDGDVTFYHDGTPVSSGADQVEVRVTLSTERKNALNLFFARAIGTSNADVSASARAGLVGTCSSECLKPFTIPAKFTWDDTCDPDPKLRNNGRLDTGSSCEMASVQVPGYTDADAGTQVVLKPKDPSDAVVPSFYNLIDFPPVNKGNPVTGGDAVRENIAGCSGSNATVVEPNDEVQIEPGSTNGPVKQGIADLVAQDPTAHWDSATNSIQGSAFSNPLDSPRVSLLGFYDPKRPPVSGRNTLFIAQVGAIFIEGIDGNGNVTARFVRAMADSPTDSGGDCLLKVSRMLRDSSRGG
ncbi:hypothetical protein dsx2_1760 [Desulfovibrio sp. X2]|uniref:TadE/TadG family type IV pilus assembly protein n=1 Tax=Desulfovibrio sp. X2 TaxID=941449 RepID=UPI000358C088|nr:TadE/TadG family type IV pilus assembly protein [Desulfovibrio sp. X2]EPR44399.1 hypothetical protein dsx2_1760 [Desulfovibrio sp. X2]